MPVPGRPRSGGVGQEPPSCEQRGPGAAAHLNAAAALTLVWGAEVALQPALLLPGIKPAESLLKPLNNDC